MNKKILIFGATGKIGSRLKEKLKKNYEVEIFSRSKGDNIADENMVNEAVKRNDVVMHLTAKQGVSKNWDEFFQVNVVGAENILNACLKFKKRLVYVSTVMVFKDTENSVKDEKWEVKNERTGNFYVDSKVEALKLAKKYMGKLDLVIVYPTIVLDKDLLKNGQKPGRWMSLVGDKNRIINIVWLNDLVNGLVKCIEINKKGEYIMGGFNISVDSYLKLLKLGSWPRVPSWIIVILKKFMGILPDMISEILKNPLENMEFSSKKAEKEWGYKISDANNAW